jgi:hypothetical protein
MDLIDLGQDRDQRSALENAAQLVASQERLSTIESTYTHILKISLHNSMET